VTLDRILFCRSLDRTEKNHYNVNAFIQTLPMESFCWRDVSYQDEFKLQHGAQTYCKSKFVPVLK